MTTDGSSPQPVAVEFERHTGIAANDVVARRCARDRVARQRQEAAVEQLLASRLETMPEAFAELRQRIAECRQRRATDTCSGRCVITGLPRTQL